jgi:tetratricopeptide (TPR) repeat protein
MSLLTQFPEIEGFRQPLFGRESDLQACEKGWATRHKPLCLYGVSGIGKTALARELYHRNKEDIAHAAWITVTDSVIKSLVTNNSLLTSLGIVFKEYHCHRPDFFDYASACIITELQKLTLIKTLNKKTKGENYRSHLWVIDNVTEQTKDVELIKKLQDHCDLRIIVTSRFPIDWAHNHKVEVLAPDVACALFRTYCPRLNSTNNSQLEPVIRLLHQHPLAITVAAIQLEAANSFSLEKFYNRLNAPIGSEISTKIIYLSTSNDHARQANMILCLNLCFEIADLQTMQPTALTMLKYFALLPNYSFTLTEITGFIDHKDIDLAEKLEDDLTYLCKMGWLYQSNEHYMMHQIITDFIFYHHLRQLPEAEQVAFILPWLDSLNANDELGNPAHYLNALAYKKMMPKTVFFINNMNPLIKEVEPDKVASLYSDAGHLFGRLDNQRLKYDYFQKALNTALTMDNGENEFVANAYSNLSCMPKDIIDSVKSLEYAKKGLALRQKINGSWHKDTASSYNDMGICYHHLDLPKKSESCLLKSVEINGKLDEDRKKMIADITYYIGIILATGGCFKDGLAYSEKALQLNLDLYGEEHEETANAYFAIGSYYKNIEDYPATLPFFEKALGIRQRVLGENHPDTAIIYVNLATVFAYLGESQKELDFWQRSFAICLEAFGDMNIQSAAAYNNLAMFYLKENDKEKALPLFEKSLAIQIHLFGENHKDTATTWVNFALALEGIGKHERALVYRIKALAALLKTGGEGDDITARCYDGLSISYFRNKNYKKAYAYSEKAYTINLKLYGEGHSNTKACKSRLDYLFQYL